MTHDICKKCRGGIMESIFPGAVQCTNCKEVIFYKTEEEKRKSDEENR